MRLILTNSAEFLIGQDMEMCLTLEDVFNQVDNSEEDDVCLIYVDPSFCSVSTLRQLEILKYEFDDFQIIIDRNLSIILEMNKKLDYNLYYVTSTTQVATDLFLKAEPYSPENVQTDLKELKWLLNNKQAVKSMIDYDYVSFDTMIRSLLYAVEGMNESYLKISELAKSHINEKLDAIRNLRLLREKLEEVELNRKELLQENLKMKFESFIERLDFQPMETNTKVAYIKSTLNQNEDPVVRMFKELNDLIRSKYNINSCLVIIEDINVIKLKKTREDFTYVISEGNYNMNLGEKVITTPQYVKSLFENWEKFSGIKDLFIVLDFSLTTRTHVIGDGTYIRIKNNNLNELSSRDSEDVLTLWEEDFDIKFEGLDEFNIKLNISRTEMFRKLESIIVGLV